MKVFLYLFLIISVNLWQNSFADSSILVSKLNELEVPEIELDYSDMANMEREQKISSSDIKNDIELLLKAKYKIINGDLKMSEFYLNKINDQTSKLLSIKRRYLALIEMLKGNFSSSLTYLGQQRIADTQNYSTVCLLKIINLMALNKTEQLKNEYKPCSSSTAKFSRNDQLWLDILVNLKLQNLNAVKKNMMTDVHYTLNNDEMARVWLKTGLYLNKESELLGLLSELPESSYQSKKIREIVALMYLRNGEKNKALMFVDDIDSANAENLKGNINLQNKEYELAFGHFRLALTKKSDSENALERAIPLAWILDQNEDGLNMLNSIPNKKNLDKRKKEALNIAFLIKLKRFTEAKNELTILKNEFQNIPPFEVNIMDNYINLILSEKETKHDKRKNEESAETSCHTFDGLSCWMSLAQLQWDNLGKTVKRDEEIFADKTITLDSLRSKKEITPIKEIPIIDQRDIEELDSNTVQINPN